MNGASREALAAARESLDALTDNTSVDVAKLAEELAAVTALLDREVSLRRVLTDPAQAGEAKAELAGRLLRGQVGGETADLIAGLMRTATTDEHARRWFRRYWTFGVGSGAHILVASLLEAARRAAEGNADE